MLRYAAVTILTLAALLPAPRPVEAQASQATMMESVDPGLLQGIQFRQVGPAQGGRSTVVTGVQSQPNTFYMGLASGGLMRTFELVPGCTPRAPPAQKTVTLLGMTIFSAYTPG